MAVLTAPRYFIRFVVNQNIFHTDDRVERLRWRLEIVYIYIMLYYDKLALSL